MQLELFSPDRWALAEGWEAVRSLDLEGARRSFEEILRRWPDTEEAREALRWLQSAQELLDGFEEEAPPGRIRRLWEAHRAFPAAGLGGRFREAVLLRLLWEMESADLGGPSESPSRGEVLLEAGRLGAALRWLADAMEQPGAGHHLHRAMGQALWCSERPKEARRQWLVWLLGLDPAEAPAAARELPDPALAALVEAHGTDAAPLHAWLDDQAPLLEDHELPARRTPALEAHRLVLAAEEARRSGDLDAAVRHREALLRLDPRILRRYMDRLG